MRYKMVFAIIFFSCFILICHSQAGTFAGLGDLPGAGFLSSAYGVSPDGSTVVGYSYAQMTYNPDTFGRPAFRWAENQEPKMQGLGGLPVGAEYSTYSYAYGASNNGIVVGKSNSTLAGQFQAFRWTAASGMVGLGDLQGGAFYSAAYGVSKDGMVVVGESASANGTEAFRLENNIMVGLGDLSGQTFKSTAYGISANGSVVVGAANSAKASLFSSEAFRWTAASGMVGLGDLPGAGFNSQAYSVSSDGNVVVGEGLSGMGNEAFRWENGEMIGLGKLTQFAYSKALGVSADGNRIIGSGYYDYNSEAFIWDKGKGMRSLQDVLQTVYGLNLTGWTLTSATGISEDGSVIVGYGIDPAGYTEAWLAKINPVPLPPAVWLFGSGLVGLAIIRRRFMK